jgi:signal transduction histidine kinase
MEETGGDIIIKGAADNRWVYISVQDTGPGIAKENHEAVFEPFFTTKKDGMGMGLYIISNIAKTFGGRLELESELGKGCTFTVTLPVMTHA